VEHVGFENPDGQRVVVITNSGQVKQAQLKLAGKVADVELPENSVSTLSWS
jgi:O-glycosyl hydrolase